MTFGLLACRPAHREVQDGQVVSLISPDGNDRFIVRSIEPGHVRVTAPRTNVGTNLRVSIVGAVAPALRDQLACVTWAAITDLTQPGVMLRVRDEATRTRGIMVTNNVIFGARWGFNVHLVDTAQPVPFTRLGGFLLPRTDPGGDWPRMFGEHPLPWRMCARAVDDLVQVIVWAPETMPQPDWGDPRFGTSLVLPAGWDVAGKGGVYAGHLAPGATLDLLDAVTGPSSCVVHPPCDSVRRRRSDRGSLPGGDGRPAGQVQQHPLAPQDVQGHPHLAQALASIADAVVHR